METLKSTLHVIQVIKVEQNKRTKDENGNIIPFKFVEALNQQNELITFTVSADKEREFALSEFLTPRNNSIAGAIPEYYKVFLTVVPTEGDYGYIKGDSVVPYRVKGCTVLDRIVGEANSKLLASEADKSSISSLSAHRKVDSAKLMFSLLNGRVADMADAADREQILSLLSQAN